MRPGGDPRALHGGYESEDSDDGFKDTFGDQHGDKNEVHVDHESEPGHVNRRCTDILCLLVFFAALGALGVIFQYCKENADLRRLYHGYDFLGNMCGLEHNGIDNSDKKVLYWCAQSTSATQIDLAHPVCRSSCPTSTETQHSCYDTHKLGPAVPVNGDAAGSFSQVVTYEYKMVNDYKSTSLMGVYCIPESNEMAEQLLTHIKENPAFNMLLEASSIQHAWPIFLGVAGLCMVLGFVYLFILEKCASCLVHGCMVIMCLGPLVVGGYCCYVYSKGTQGLDGLPSTGDSQWDLIIGLSCLVLGVVFCVISFCFHSAIETAIAVVQATSECLMDMPSLLIEPVITNIWKLMVLSAMGSGFLWLLSCGEISSMTLQQYASMPGTELNGVFRKFTYDEREMYYIAYYVFMIFWCMELATAVSQFALAYAVQLWYFTPYVTDHDKDHVTACPVVFGYCAGIFYHLGTMAFGSFFIALTRLIRWILSYIAKQARAQENAAAECAAKVCMCFVTCFQRCLEFINKNAYMDVAVNSTSFCFAARNALSIIFKNFPDMAMLNGATWIFQLAGVGAITGSGVGITFLILENVTTFSDPTSSLYVKDPILVLIITAFLCILISYAFMMVYDMVADTVLYCKCVEEMRRKANSLDPQVRYAPYALDELIRGGGNYS